MRFPRNLPTRARSWVAVRHPYASGDLGRFYGVCVLGLALTLDRDDLMLTLFYVRGDGARCNRSRAVAWRNS